MTDQNEKKIIRSLNANCRKSFREIAKETGASPTAVIYTVKKLESSGVLKGYVPVVDPEYFGFSLTAVIAVRISKGKLIEVQKKIAEDPHVSAVYDVTGDWDSFIIGRFAGRDDLNGFIKKLLAVPNIDRTLTHIVLNVVKEDPRVPV